MTPGDAPGWHDYTLAPGGKLAFHTYSSFERPAMMDVVSLPDHRSLRQLLDPAVVQRKVAGAVGQRTEFLTVRVADGVTLDGWMIRPASFDASKKYPVIVFVYGEPASQTVTDAWGGGRLFYRALADAGYVVVSVDNRGTPAPKGAAWRKVDLRRRRRAVGRRIRRRRSRRSPRRIRSSIWRASASGDGAAAGRTRSTACSGFPTLYKVGVSVAPVPDQRLYDTIYQERYMGVPEQNAEGYQAGSPINFAQNLKGDLLIVHGSGDDNVHYQGTERLVNRLVELGKPFDLMVYPNRSHSISEGPGTTAHVYQLDRTVFRHAPAARSAVSGSLRNRTSGISALNVAEQRRVELAAVGERRGELGAAVELPVLQERRGRMIGAIAARHARHRVAGELLEAPAERGRARRGRASPATCSAMCSRMRTSSGGSGRHIPPPIQTQPGAISKYRPAPCGFGSSRVRKIAAACVFSGFLLSLNRVSR